LNHEQLFCGNCAAKVVTERITIKKLLSDLASNVFGWDNKFFFTVRMLILKPEILFKEYIDGTRKKYMNPLSLLTLTAALAIFVFNFFAEDYLALNIETNKQSIEMISSMMEKQLGEEFDAATYKKEQMERITDLSSFMLKYFNLIVLLLLPLYTFLAFLTYRRPYNYGEHLVINSYIQGLSFLATSLLFTISVFTNPSVYMLAIVLLVIYYTYAYGRLYKLSVAESILSFLKFSGILIFMIIGTGILSLIAGIAIGYLSQ
jgi:hypothetical protein